MLLNWCDVGKAGECIKADDPPVHVVGFVHASKGGECAEVSSAVDSKFHDHAGHVENHAIERVKGEQVRKGLAAEIQCQIVDQFICWDRRVGEQFGPGADGPLAQCRIRAAIGRSLYSGCGTSPIL